jgi:uncharacterized paraquat-inducible protein A
MPRSLCPACDGAFSIPGKPQLGQKIACPFCGEKLQVVWENPLELDWADYNEEEVLQEDIEETSDTE